MNTDRTEFTPILRTGQMLSFDWVCGELDEAGIPYQCREESSGGIQMAMPAFPSVMPGTWWTVLVPKLSAPTGSRDLGFHAVRFGTDAGRVGLPAEARGQTALAGLHHRLTGAASGRFRLRTPQAWLMKGRPSWILG